MISVVSNEEKQVLIQKLQEYKEKLALHELELIEIVKIIPVFEVEIRELKDAYDIMNDIIYGSKNVDITQNQKLEKSSNELLNRRNIKRKQLSDLKRKNERLLRDIPIIKNYIQHGEFLISMINSFEKIVEIPVYDDFEFLKPMNIGYDYIHPEPMEFVIEEISNSVWSMQGTSNIIFKFSENSLQAENGKILKFNKQRKSAFLFLFHYFQINNHDLNNDKLFQNIVDNSHLQLLDFTNIDGGTSTSTNFSCKMNIYNIESSWSGKYVNAPLRLKFVINYLLSLSK